VTGNQFSAAGGSFFSFAFFGVTKNNLPCNVDLGRQIVPLMLVDLFVP
jgi:hypothetical protein